MSDSVLSEPARAAEPSPPSPAKRFKDALFIVDPGACNPSGIAHAIVAACQEARAEGIATTKDVAVQLMVTQLAWVTNGNSDIDDYGDLLAECRRRAGAE